jgi:hypothetical protein
VSDTREENTRWISVWIINDGDYYWRARDVADTARQLDDYSILQEHIAEILASRATETVKAVVREMSEADMDTVDWEEVANDLLSE